jgi:BspA type Leucine rich repeat region (6 copies)
MSEITNGMSGLEAREILNEVTTRPYTDWGLTNYIILGGEFEAPIVEALLVTNLVEFDYDPEDNVSKFKATRPYAINFTVPLPITSWYDDACVSIAKEVFKDNTTLETIEFTNLRSIGPSAFESASALTSVNMPLLTEIPGGGFRFCSNLTDISFDNVEIVKSSPNGAFEGSGVTGINDTNFPSLITVESGAFSTSANLAVINNTSITDWQGNFTLPALTSITLPNVTTLTSSSSAFADCASLTNIDIPATVDLVGYVFKGCSSLVTLTGSDLTVDSTTITGGNNFEGCTSLTELSIADCTEITEGSNFKDCSSLTELSLPLVTTLTGGNNFQGCTDLTEISLDALVNLTNTEFSGCTSLTTIYMPQLSATGEVNIFDGLPDDGAITVNTAIGLDTNWTTVVEPYLVGKDWTITYFGA